MKLSDTVGVSEAARQLGIHTTQIYDWRKKIRVKESRSALNEAAATARTSLAEQRSQLDALQRENTNLTTLNSGLSVRIDNKQSTPASTDAQLLALKAQRTAEQREWEALQTMMTSRLADKDDLIISLQRQIAEPPSDPDAPVKNDTGGD